MKKPIYLLLTVAALLFNHTAKANPPCVTNAILQFVNPPCGVASNIVDFPSGLNATNDNGAWRWSPNCAIDPIEHDCDGSFPRIIIYLPQSCCAATGYVTVATISWHDGATGNSHFVGVQMPRNRKAQTFEIACYSYSDGTCELSMRPCDDYVPCELPPCEPPCP